MDTNHFYKMDANSIKAVVNFFRDHERGTAKDIGVNPQFLTSLVQRGAIKVYGDIITGYTPVGNGLYRANVAHVYAMAMDIDDFRREYIDCVHFAGNEQRRKAVASIEYAEKKLEEAKRMLSFCL